MTTFDRATPQDTIEDLVKGSRKKGVPLRRTFLQGGTRLNPEPGPLATFVTNGDHRGLDLYLLFLATASHPPYSTRQESAKVWARAMDLESSADASGVASVLKKRRPSKGVAALAKVWARLKQRRLITTRRVRRHTEFTALREDGSGEPYTYPDGKSLADYYFTLPVAYWTAEEWYRRLDLPELAVLLIARSRGDDFILPLEQAPRWYGISADTAARGLKGLQERGLLAVREIRKPAPRAPDGFTLQRHYTLRPPFGPMGRRDSNAPKTRKTDV